MGEVLGIDVSHHNGEIDWELVSMGSTKFAIMKAQYEAKSHRIDEFFEYNYKEAGKWNIARGVYIFIASDSIKDPVLDATSLLKKLKGRTLEYGIWLDLESDALRRCGREQITKLIYIYANIFRAAGYYVGIYCNRDWYLNVLESKKLSLDFDFWIARYPRDDRGTYNPNSSLKPTKYASAWQYSSKGNISGIRTRCDLDVDFDGVINLMTSAPAKKYYRDIAHEVIAGKWGTASTNPTRKELLEAAGYDYKEIQAIVNSILKRK